MYADLGFAEYNVSQQAFCKPHASAVQHYLIARVI